MDFTHKSDRCHTSMTHVYVHIYIIKSNNTYTTVVVYSVLDVIISSEEMARLRTGFTGIPRPYYDDNNNNNTLRVTRHGHYIIIK